MGLRPGCSWLAGRQRQTARSVRSQPCPPGPLPHSWSGFTAFLPLSAPQAGYPAWRAQSTPRAEPRSFHGRAGHSVPRSPGLGRAHCPQEPRPPLRSPSPWAERQEGKAYFVQGTAPSTPAFSEQPSLGVQPQLGPWVVPSRASLTSDPRAMLAGTTSEFAAASECPLLTALKSTVPTASVRGRVLVSESGFSF